MINQRRIGGAGGLHVEVERGRKKYRAGAKKWTQAKSEGASLLDRETF